MTQVTRPFVAATPRRRSWADLVIFAAVVVLVYVLVQLGQSIAAPFDPGVSTTVSTDPAQLPLYAARSLLRMFVALAASLVFTFVYATIAARVPRASRILMPALDILQSVPVLGFLSVTVTLWIALFPGSELGLECASIFAIFTSQAWNMAFAFYQSLVTQPRELDEAARVLRLTKWQRFWRLDVPSGIIPLVWNGMMSFGGGWFFLTVSEMISVNNKTYALPGIGSYVAAASANQEPDRILLAIGVMIVMVVGVNLVFWRPLTAWAERFRLGDSEASEAPRSAVLGLLRRSHIPPALGRLTAPARDLLDRVMRPLGLADRRLIVDARRTRAFDVAFAVVWIAVIGYGLWRMLAYVADGVGLGEFGTAFGLGLLTFVRVAVVLVGSTLVWVPVAVWIGMNPRVSAVAQPIVQVLASFPANFLFPFFTLALITTGIGLDVGGIVLMALGSQWYILFNVIAGAAAIPNDLREAATSLGLNRVQRWRRLIVPGIFSSWVTGAITAAGGAWNASIVAEIVTYGDETLTAQGLGSYITEATTSGDFPRVLVGVTVMSIFVVGLNRTLWQRLYSLAERRYSY